jgi:hypothetical protein
MVTVRRYIELTQAELDKSLLEAEGIPAFIPDENSSAIGYAVLGLGGIRLQVSDEDTDRAQQVLGEEKEATPLPDDFIPPPEEAPPVEPTRKPILDDGSANAFMWGGTAGLAVFAAVALFTLIVGGFAFVNLGGLVFLFFAGGVVGLVVHANFPRRPNGGA